MFVSNLLYCIISSNKSWDRKKKDQQLLINWSVMFTFQISFLFSWLKRENYRDGYLPTYQLYRYFWFFGEFYANNTKFQIKRGGHRSFCPPLNPPLLTDITSRVTFTHPSNQFEDCLRINPNLVGHKWKDKKTKSSTTFILLDHENKVTKINNI